MHEELDRRAMLKGALTLGGLAALGIPYWTLPALAQGEEMVPFTDVPESFKPGVTGPTGLRYPDTREFDSFYTSNDDFYIVQHYGRPDVDPATHRLKISGLLDRPREYSLADLKAMEPVERDVGFECGGNQTALLHALAGNARWKGVALSTLMKDWGVQPEGSEVVFFGADSGEEEIRRANVEMKFARSLSLEDARRPEIMLAYEMNGEPLPHAHGGPLRLIVPGWYGIANVKWLDRIHFQNTRWMGRFMAKDNVTLRRRQVGDELQWTLDSVSRTLLKSVVVRVTRAGNSCTVTGFALTNGTPLAKIEVKIDDGPWHEAGIDPQSNGYSWTLFRYTWNNPSKGDHTIVSRATDTEGNVQPTQAEVPQKITYWENPGQWPRTVRIS